MRASQSGPWAKRTQTGRNTIVRWGGQWPEKCQVLGFWSSDSDVPEGRQRSKLGPLSLCFPLEGGGQKALWSQLVCLDGQNLVRSLSCATTNKTRGPGQRAKLWRKVRPLVCG